MASNLDSARTGDRRKALETLRDTLAAQIDSTEAQVHAQLAAQYRATLADLAELDAAQPKPKGTPLDEITARRQARDRVPADRVRTAGGRKPRDG